MHPNAFRKPKLCVLNKQPINKSLMRRFVTGECSTEKEIPLDPSATEFYYRPNHSRGFQDFGWLQAKYSFSFSPFYKEPNHRGFRKLRVINEDVVQPGKGFEPHSHQNMEIVTYVLKGALEHKDSLGNGSIIKPGEVQRMTAGRGITHSEFNPSKADPVHLLQIWIMPAETGLQPSYEQVSYTPFEKIGKFKLIAGPNGGHEAVKIHQDTYLYASELKEGQEVKFQVPENRGAWIHVVSGCVVMNQWKLHTGDGLGISKPMEICLRKAEHSNEKTEVLLFDLN